MMDEDTKFCDWTNTRKALDYLEELLQCRACLKTVNDPCTLGNCDHIFCRNCVHPFSGYCPKCKVPSHVKDVKPNRQIKVTLLHCKQMRTILGLNKTHNENNIVMDESEQQIQKENHITENDVHCFNENLENNVTSSPNRKVITPKWKSPKKAELQKSTEILPNDQLMDHQSSLNNLDQPVDKLQYASDKLVNTSVNDSVNDQNLDQTIQTDGNLTINAEQLVTVQKVLKSTLKMGQILLGKSNTNTPKIATRSSRLKKAAAKEEKETFATITVSSISPKMTTPKSRLSQYLKRNALGETALHTSVIKGQVDDVRKLLAEGSNPNLKDNAGWSPLHEACNHGHLEIATILLDNGAIVNASGMDNVTPLHDAVSNNHLNVAALLITRGADLHLRNINGLTARDLATSKEMRRILETTFPTVAINTNIAVNNCDEIIILTTGLSGIQEQNVLKCSEFLKAKVVKDFADNVTHLVTACNDNGVCARTIKFLTGILTGKWIMKFEWIEACLLTESREDEEKFEIKGCTTNLNGDGPRRGRLSHQMQHPGLFSGCQFYFRGNFSFPNPPKKHLENLVQKGQGVILSREPKVKMDGQITVPFHALPNSSISKCTYFVIYSQENMPRVKQNTDCIRYLPVSWLLDCVATFQIIDLTDSHV